MTGHGGRIWIEDGAVSKAKSHIGQMVGSRRGIARDADAFRVAVEIGVAAAMAARNLVARQVFDAAKAKLTLSVICARLALVQFGQANTEV